MCTRYVSPEQREIESFWSLGPRGNDPNPFGRRFNVAPRQRIPILYRRGGMLELGEAVWGLVPIGWRKPEWPKFATFNARLETAASLWSFRIPFREKRCLIPAVGWYEYEDTGIRKPRGSGTIKRPHYVTLGSEEPAALAGLWTEWVHPETGEVMKTAAMLTCEPCPVIAEFHDRMPIPLDREGQDRWLDPGISDPAALEAILKAGMITDLRHREANPAVNNVKTGGGDELTRRPVVDAAGG